MKRLTTILVALTFALVALGGNANNNLAPDESTTLADHLIEVNAQWAKKDLSSPLYQQKTSFKDEADRIRTHLLMVSEYLESNTPEHLTNDQRSNRIELINELRDYAMDGKFPVNSGHQLRIPYFIDKYDNACAVGHLMRKSGAKKQASYIHNILNFSYIGEMPEDKIMAWATPNGFTLAELKWIQPGYPPNTLWIAPGGGTDGVVRGLVKTGDGGEYIVFGDFSTAGNTSANKIARWNGEEFEALGSGLDGEPRAGVIWNNQLVIGGAFQNGTSTLAVWDEQSSTWDYHYPIQGKSASIGELAIFNGELHAAGYMSGFAGIDHVIAKVDSEFEGEILGIFNDEVSTLSWHDGALIAGGKFTLNEDDGVETEYLARLNGTEWTEYLGGVEGEVRALHSTGDRLFVGGTIDTENPEGHVGLKVYGDGGWITPNFSFTQDSEYITGFEPLGGDLLVHGDFTNQIDGVGTFGNGMCALNIDQLTMTGMIAVNEEVMDVISINNQLICGGSFTEDFLGNELSHLAAQDVSSGNVEVEYHPVKIYPNPTSEQMRIELNDISADQVKIYSLSGQQVRSFDIDRSMASTNLDVSDIAEGSYVVTVRNEGEVQGVRTLVIAR